MASGFLALLDDIAAITKVAAASIDDAAAQAVKVGSKAAGIVIDDAAVTPRYVVGFAADRELPIIVKIAWGSLKNKLLFLLPGALVLSYFAPWAITPLLMAGGAYLCLEGYEKVHDLLYPNLSAVTVPPTSPASPAPLVAIDAHVSEQAKIASAIRTDFILSAEIMALSLAAITTMSLWSTALTLAFVGIFVTVGVYGAVALIVKADDFGLFLAQQGRLASTRRFGRGLVKYMPTFLEGLGLLGMLAMLWVGGGIILHGLEAFGFAVLPGALHTVAESVGVLFGPLEDVIAWLINATFAGVIGLGVGWLAAKLVEVSGFSH